MHPIASCRQPLCPSVRIADRLPITRIVLITAAETYRPILIATVAANGRDSLCRSEIPFPCVPKKMCFFVLRYSFTHNNNEMSHRLHEFNNIANNQSPSVELKVEEPSMWYK